MRGEKTLRLKCGNDKGGNLFLKQERGEKGRPKTFLEPTEGGVLPQVEKGKTNEGFSMELLEFNPSQAKKERGGIGPEGQRKR